MKGLIVRIAAAVVLGAAIVTGSPGVGMAADATALIRAAFDNWRANSSESTVTMTIHRPGWERHLTMKGWTQGHDKALARFTAPAKDAGNATLKLGKTTLIFNPKLNQVIKLPASMLAQSWMGSDFSYNDLSKAEDILTEYSHKIIGTGHAGGHTVYSIEALPKPGAPVVWGKQQVKVRDDGVLLQETFFDQDMRVVRQMTTDKVGRIGGRDYPVVVTMRPAAKKGQWTRLDTTAARFNVPIPAYVFTRSNLQNPRN
ncbi:outer membrane lipoprotein-sorting protein [Allgaiera indica]|uniref:Outer membrane lipoprotein-sorting protein n=1 Tax=Allgaiera indica TaxID=765699 RepID=A0AAN4UUA6_9RHOB|nr:outer membrane lipoprotein-sorting protein [Allgaiera indica]SDX72602.1 Outer membrane lipoprotein-sorting protein [Allgaiera indica]